MSPDLPIGWAWARVEDLAEINSGSTPSNAEAQSEASGEIPWFKVSSMNLQGNETQMRHSQWWFNRNHAEKLGLRVIKSGSLIFPKLGGALLTNKRRVLAIDAAIDMNLMAITAYGPFQDYLNRFFDILDMANFSDGSVVPQLKKSILQIIPIPLAPLPEQRRIVARIDELFAELAKGEAALERARQGLDTWRRVLLKAAVTGELTRNWREANRPAETGADLLARIRAERGASIPRLRRGRRSAASEPMNGGSLPELPDGWTWTILGECISHLTSGSRDWSQYYDRGTAVFVMAQNIRPGRYNHDYIKNVAPPVGDAETARTRLRRNDLLVTIVGANTGDVCRVDFDPDHYFVCQSVALVRPVLRDMSEFLELYFVARDGGRGEFEKVIYGAGRPHLSFDQLLETRVPLPSLVEMQEIVRRVRLEEGSALVEQEFAGFHRDLLALRQSVLKAAFEGQLAAQDPSDEPASALLARLGSNYHSNGARRRRARTTTHFSHPSLPGLTRQSVDARVEPAGDE